MWQLYILAGELFAITALTLTKYFTSVSTIYVDYVIVGAGASGVAAASMLMQYGVDSIVILEAENQTGGRINTVPFGDGVVELGCQWVHGEEGNVIFRMASQHDLLMESVVSNDFEKMFFIDSSGNIVDREQSAELLGILNEISESSEKDLVNFTGSLGEYVTREYSKKLEMLALSNSSLATAFLDWFHKAQNIFDSADSWFETSGINGVEYKECEGKQNWAWKSGYSTVLDLLMRKIPDPANELPVRNKTNLSKEVKKIMWNILSGRNKNRVVVECADRSVYAARHVIVTVSLGVLKERAESMFEPALPEEKLNAIKGLSIGTVDKIYLKFPFKWWPDGFNIFNVLKTNETAPCTDEKCWLHEIFAFQAVDNQPLILSAWLSGSAARYMEQLSEEEVKQETYQFLSELMGTALDITVPPPERILRSSWSSNPHFRGSYSFRSMETERRGVSAAQLSEPVANDNGISVLHFAGEATHSSYFSTVHGAIETVAHGVVKNGAHRYPDGTRYVGDWNHRGQKHGMGHLCLPNGTRYDGAFQNGLCTGLGVMCFPDGAKYEGEFMQGWFHGHGVFWRADGMKFEGEFRGGRIWGLGLVTFNDHSHGFPRNEGFFQDCRLVRKKRCPEVVQRAQKVALLARAQCD